MTMPPFSLYAQVDMRLRWINGRAHAAAHASVSPMHTIRVRLGAGFGTESFGGANLKPVIWRPGALEYLPASCSYAHTTGGECDWMSIEIDESELHDICGGPTAFRRPLACSEGHCFQPDRDWLKTAFMYVSHGSVDWMLAESLCLPIIEACQRASNQFRAEHTGAGLSAATLRRLVEFIEAHLQSNITLMQLANEAMLSKFYFATAFKASTGCTPYRYVLERRLNRARAMLRESQTSLTCIGLDCGFSSHAHFTTRFTERFGVSPSLYRTALHASPSQ